MTAPKSVVIDGVRYVPVGEVDIAARLMTALAEEYWGKDAKEAKDPHHWQHLCVLVTDDKDEHDTSIEDFAAKIITRLSGQ